MSIERSGSPLTESPTLVHIYVFNRHGLRIRIPTFLESHPTLEDRNAVPFENYSSGKSFDIDDDTSSIAVGVIPR